VTMARVHAAQAQCVKEQHAPEDTLGADALREEHLGHLGVHGRERVIKKRYVRARIRRAGKREPRLLPPAEVDTALANLCCICRRQPRDVVLERARRDHTRVPACMPRMGQPAARSHARACTP
jgi:hypothetical protein